MLCVNNRNPAHHPNQRTEQMGLRIVRMDDLYVVFSDVLTERTKRCQKAMALQITNPGPFGIHAATKGTWLIQTSQIRNNPMSPTPIDQPNNDRLQPPDIHRPY